MRKGHLGAILLLVCLVILIVGSCHKAPKIRPQAKNVVTEIHAPKLRIFELTSMAFIKRGFTISVANEALGLLTTEFKTVQEGLQDIIALSLRGDERIMQVQFVTNITGKNDVHYLTIMAKGRYFSKKKGYQEYVFSDEFMNDIRKIGEEIKFEAEGK